MRIKKGIDGLANISSVSFCLGQTPDSSYNLTNSIDNYNMIFEKISLYWSVHDILIKDMVMNVLKK